VKHGYIWAKQKKTKKSTTHKKKQKMKKKPKPNKIPQNNNKITCKKSVVWSPYRETALSKWQSIQMFPFQVLNNFTPFPKKMSQARDTPAGHLLGSAKRLERSAAKKCWHLSSRFGHGQGKCLQ